MKNTKEKGISWRRPRNKNQCKSTLRMSSSSFTINCFCSSTLASNSLTCSSAAAALVLLSESSTYPVPQFHILWFQINVDFCASSSELWTEQSSAIFFYAKLFELSVKLHNMLMNFLLLSFTVTKAICVSYQGPPSHSGHMDSI